MHAFKVKYIYEKLRQEELESHVYVDLASYPSLSEERADEYQIPQVDQADGLFYIESVVLLEVSFSLVDTEMVQTASSTKGNIPPEAELSKNQPQAEKVDSAADLAGSDEEVDPDLLRKGELEG